LYLGLKELKSTTSEEHWLIKIFPSNLYYFTRVLNLSLAELSRQAKTNIFLKSYSLLLAKTSKQKPNTFI